MPYISIKDLETRIEERIQPLLEEGYTLCNEQGVLTAKGYLDGFSSLYGDRTCGCLLGMIAGPDVFMYEAAHKLGLNDQESRVLEAGFEGWLDDHRDPLYKLGRRLCDRYAAGPADAST